MLVVVIYSSSMSAPPKQQQVGLMAGTGFIAAFPDLQLTLGGFTFTNVQMLLWTQVLGEILIPIFVLRNLPKLVPDEA